MAQITNGQGYLLAHKTPLLSKKLESDILIVDDEVSLVSHLQTLLSWENYQTRQAGNGMEAMTLIDEQPPSVIVTDITMPHVDGYELLTYVQTYYPQIPVVVMTGYGSIDSAIKSLQLGAFDYALKPFENRLILETITRAAEKARLNRYEQLRQEIAEAVGGTLTLDLMMAQVFNLAKRGVGADTGGLFILDEVGQVIKHINADSHNQTMAQQKERVNRVMDYGLAGWIYLHQQGTIIPDTDQDARWFDMPGRSYEARSVIGIPFISRGIIQGIIVLMHSQTNQFDKLDLDFLNTASLPTAMAIENARLFDRVHQKSQEMTILYQTGLSLASSLDYEIVLQTALEQIAAVMSIDRCAILQWNRTEDKAEPVFSLVRRNGTWQSMLNLDEINGLSTYASAGEVIRDQKVVINSLDMPELDEDARTWMKNSNIHTCLLYPLVLHSETTGIIMLGYANPDKQFTAYHQRLLQGLTSQLSVTLENIQLFEKVNRQSAQVEAQAKELDDERRKLAAILESSTDLLLAIDDNGQILLTNSALEQAFEVDAAAVTGQNYEQALQDTAINALFEAVRVDNKVHQYEVRSGSGRTYVVNVTPVPQVGYVALMRDISHLKELDKMRSELLSTASHDLKNPITAIQGFAFLMKRAGGLTAEQETLIDRINQATHRMFNLVRDILDLAQLESGLSLQLELCNLNDLVESSLSEVYQLAKLKHVAVSVTYDESLPEIVCDSKRIRQVLNNLLSNAIKYTPEQGQILVETKTASTASIHQEDSGVAVSVKDTGIGIHPRYLSKIFDRFYRVKTPETQSVEGTGLGLAIVNTIIEQHQGHIDVESTPGQGSNFTFSLPV